MMRVQRSIHGPFALLLLSSALGLAACRTPEPASPGPELTSAGPEPVTPPLGRGAPRVRAEGPYSMYVTPPVQRFCSGTAPFFEFDSSDTRWADQHTMGTLAECMMSGPLAGKTIKLIGRTDPRGTAEYNDKLGLERAERVKEYLVGHGVEPYRVLVESAGESGASPIPEGWAKDRRVEIQLVP